MAAAIAARIERLRSPRRLRSEKAGWDHRSVATNNPFIGTSLHLSTQPQKAFDGAGENRRRVDLERRRRRERRHRHAKRSDIACRKTVCGRYVDSERARKSAFRSDRELIAGNRKRGGSR